MTMIQKVVADLESVAMSLADASDDEQAEFLNVMGKVLWVDCETQYRFQSQCEGIVSHLNRDGMRLALELGGFAELRQKGIDQGAES